MLQNLKHMALFLAYGDEELADRMTIDTTIAVAPAFRREYAIACKQWANRGGPSNDQLSYLRELVNTLKRMAPRASWDVCRWASAGDYTFDERLHIALCESQWPAAKERWEAEKAARKPVIVAEHLAEHYYKDAGLQYAPTREEIDKGWTVMHNAKFEPDVSRETSRIAASGFVVGALLSSALTFGLLKLFGG